MIKINRNSLEIIFPDRDWDGKQVDPVPIRNCVIRAFGSIGLGGSYSDQIGVWVNKAGKITHEGNQVLRVSFSDDMWPELVSVVMKFSALTTRHFKQAELAVYVNNVLVLTSTGLEDGSSDVGVCVDSPKRNSPLSGEIHFLKDNTFSGKYTAGQKACNGLLD